MTGQLQWQIDQGAKCGCRGHDDYCPCQNVDFSAPPTPQGDVAASEPPASIEEEARDEDAALKEILTYAGVNGVLIDADRERLKKAHSALSAKLVATKRGFNAWYERAGENLDRALAAEAEVRRLKEAGQAIIDRMSSTYKARNGREIGIEGDDGEKCWIVHSDQIAALQGALQPATIADRTGEGE